MVAVREGSEVGGGELVAYAKQHLAKYKYPREVIVVDDVPADQRRQDRPQGGAGAGRATGPAAVSPGTPVAGHGVVVVWTSSRALTCGSPS